MAASHPLKPLVVNGFMGTGKSTAARIVAERAGVPFVDLDAFIEAEQGSTIEALFRERGEPAFRALEGDALLRVTKGSTPRVIAVGGGALVDRATRRALLDEARVVTLTASIPVLLERTRGAGRPLLGAAEDREKRIAELLEARRAAYAEAHATIDTSRLSPSEVAEAVTRAWEASGLVVPLGERTYAVRIARNAPEVLAQAVASLAPSAAFIITDENVQRIAEAAALEALRARAIPIGGVVVLKPGEAQKQIAAVETALRAMVTAQADRDAVVIAIGGGVVSDIAGFAASALLRGVRWVVAPTTLLSMVDASVGGKTGVDVGQAKNAAGAFHQPSAVVVGPGYVRTESERGYIGGLAEVVKSGAIGDPDLLSLLESRADAVLARDLDVVEELVLRSIAVKARIVSRDERESGDRALLNFGHTVGHALEADGAYERLTHGEAVSLGMVAMLRVGRALGLTDPAFADRLVAILDRLGLPTDIDAQPLKRALPLIGLDKKRRGNAVRTVVVRGAGDSFVHPMKEDAIARALGLG
jgi:shikimate kinase/3-dehydroquinate synthase